MASTSDPIPPSSATTAVPASSAPSSSSAGAGSGATAARTTATVYHPSTDTRRQTEDVTKTKGVEWVDMALKTDLLMGLMDKGFAKPSPIQEESIPIALAGKSLLARAKNGTGKTASFCIPCLQRVDLACKDIQALVLVPTRELCLQTSSVLKELGKYMEGLQVATVYGGTDTRDDVLRVRQTVHILVATPGRILDLAKRSACRLDNCKLIALDEADKLLSDVFLEHTQELLDRFLPAQRQILLFSATFPVSIKSFRDRYMRGAHAINLMEELTLKGVTQCYAYVTEKLKVRCLETLFTKLEINQCIIFCNSTPRVELLAQRITTLGYPCFYIHGAMKQEDRNRVFHAYREGKCRFLVSSDLFTRGIDVPSVNVVINFDFPRTGETYLHRIGRSGRFGHLGLAINFVTDADAEVMFRIERELATEIKALPEHVDRELYCM